MSRSKIEEGNFKMAIIEENLNGKQLAFLQTMTSKSDLTADYTVVFDSEIAGKTTGLGRGRYRIETKKGQAVIRRTSYPKNGHVTNYQAGYMTLTDAVLDVLKRIKEAN